MSDRRKNSASSRTPASGKPESGKKAKTGHSAKPRQGVVLVSKSNAVPLSDWHSPQATPARSEYPLAFGEYVPANSSDSSDQVWRARLVLLDAISRVYPIFFETLSKKVFPLYSRGGFDFEQIFAGRSGTSPYERLTEDAKLIALKTELHEWTARFNADSASWLLDAALHTMRGWYGIPERRNSLCWDLPLSRVIAPVPAIAFECPGWEVQGLTFAEYREFVDRQLVDYEKKIRKMAESRGLVRSQRQFSQRNFDWFVLYQFAAWSSGKIAGEGSLQSEKGLDESTVLKGIKTVAHLISWNDLRKTHQQNRKTH